MVDTSQVEVNNPSLAAFFSALIFYLVVGSVLFALFCYYRPKKIQIYAPRNMTTIYSRMADPLYEHSRFVWIAATIKINREKVYTIAGPDAAMFMHSLYSNIWLFVFFSVVAIPTLLGVDIYQRGTAKSLEVLTMSNIITLDNRVWAHVVLFIIFSLATIYSITVDAKYYIKTRKRYLCHPDYQRQARANTIIVKSIPQRLNNEQDLLSIFSTSPNVVRAFPCPSYLAIMALVLQRNRHIRELEMSVCRYLRHTFRRYAKGNRTLAKRPTIHQINHHDHKQDHRLLWLLSLPAIQQCRNMWMKTEEVDSIGFHCEQIVQLNSKICQKRAAISTESKSSNTAIVVFSSQKAAHDATRLLQNPKWYRRLFPATSVTCWPRYTDIDPDDMDWTGVSVSPKLKRMYKFVSRIAIFLVITLWIFPVVFISALTQLSQLSSFGFLKDIADWPTPLAGLVEGVFPPFILGLLQWAIPEVFRYSLSFEGMPTTWFKEMALMNYILWFQVVDAFIIPVAASTIFTSIPTFLRNPVAAAETIVAKIPTVSTFFMAYVLMRALTNASMQIARAEHVLKYAFIRLFGGQTPRISAQRARPSNFQYAEQIPIHSLVFLLGVMYCSIAPLMSVVNVVYFLMFEFVLAYKFTHVYDDSSFRLGGRIAFGLLEQKWLSLYAAEIVFCGATAIRTSTDSSIQSVLQLISVCLTLVLTIGCHIVVRRKSYPQLRFPVTDNRVNGLDVEVNNHETPTEKEDNSSGSISGNTMDDSLSTESASECPPSTTENIQCKEGMVAAGVSAMPKKFSFVNTDLNPDRISVQSIYAASRSFACITANSSPSSDSFLGFNSRNSTRTRARAAAMSPFNNPTMHAELTQTPTPLPYEPWRVDMRPDTRNLKAGSLLLGDAILNSTALLPNSMKDPGYSFIWLPTINITSSTNRVHLARLFKHRSVSTVFVDAALETSHQQKSLPNGNSKVIVTEEEHGEGCEYPDIESFADALYAEIRQRLGVYGHVVCDHAVFDGHKTRSTTITFPESPVHRILRRA